MKILKITGVAILAVSLTNCGVLLHPERQGQSGGRIDPAVALLDGVGLLLYVIPGLIAFAIDFHQGTIYIPHTSTDATDLNKSSRTVKIEGPITEEKVEGILRKELGMFVDLKDPSLRVAKGENTISIHTQVALLSQ